MTDHSLISTPMDEQPRTPIELAFVLAPRQNLFFTELVEALSTEVQGLGARSSVHVGGFPPPQEDLIYVVVPPHEYFTLMHGRIGPPSEVLRRTIFICAEQPDTSFFDENIRLVRPAGAVFDISRQAVSAFAANGIEAQHLQLGWTQGWTRLPEARSRHHERDIDVLFMGCLSNHREESLARYARLFARRRTCLVLSDNSRPNWMPSDSFRVADDKFALMGRAKVLINIHQGDSPYFEWLRMVQAMSNGAVVVTEHSRDYEPLVLGKHFLSGEADSLHLLAELLLEDGDYRWKMQTAAYDLLHDQLRLENSVSQLIVKARRLAMTEPLPEPNHPFFTQSPPDPGRFALFADARMPPSSVDSDPNTGAIRRALKDIRLELRGLRNEQRRLDLTISGGKAPPQVQLVRQSGAYAAFQPEMSVLVALYNHEEHIVDALDSLLASEERSWEVIIVDDGSSDHSQGLASDWIGEHEGIAATLLAHPVNRGLGHARNTALGWARGDLVFVLDADNEVLPHCLTRLKGALIDNSDAAFAYGILERFCAGESIGLMGMFPWDPKRLRLGNYIDAMALMRKSVVCGLGGYTTDRRLHGWEDYELWCHMASKGHCAVNVPEIVARYRTTRHSMLSLTNLSVTDAFSLLVERYPDLMSGVVIPD